MLQDFAVLRWTDVMFPGSTDLSQLDGFIELVQGALQVRQLLTIQHSGERIQRAGDKKKSLMCEATHCCADFGLNDYICSSFPKTKHYPVSYPLSVLLLLLGLFPHVKLLNRGGKTQLQNLYVCSDVKQTHTSKQRYAPRNTLTCAMAAK